MLTGCPSIAASASMPPTPHPSTPSPFTIVVCESVPTSVSGYAITRPSAPGSVVNTTRARCSRFTWWQIPIPGGTAEKFRNAVCPHFKNAYLSRFRWYSSAAFMSYACAVPNSSTCTEWSITSSAGCSGLIRSGSPPSSRIASRIAARSTMAGTPVKSCISTRAGI